ncbi:MAG: DUF853 family protein [Clostridia bacterium]|nr:DUF853 family protein [Clostridia bacterium]
MLLDNKLYIGNADGEKVFIHLNKANRHGLIAGATGTGKTTTLRVMAESFSNAGVPVFLADAKGDLATLCQPGTMSEPVQKRLDAMGLAADGFSLQSYPVTFWDVYQEMGLPLRATVSEVGPLLLSRILGLNDTQSAIMSVIFKIADDEGLLLIDSKDLRSMLTYVGENAKEYSLTYGNIAKQSLTAIIRSVIALEAEGGDKFFGEPALDIHDWLATDASGKGKVHILDCQRLMNNPTMYSTFMLWMMSELYETLPEVGDLEKPKIVFFFDEAHMLFDDASKELLQKIEQVVKLIRSKGVGIYFITQNPADIPDGVLAQLGNKVQHALHAYTPAEQKKAKAASDSFRVNPAFDTYETLLALGTGEALISVLDESGVPTLVQKCNILPPQSLMGTLDNVARSAVIQGDVLNAKYGAYVDNDSAYEFLQRKNLADAEAAEAEKAAKEAEKEAAKAAAAAEKAAAKAEADAAKAAEREAAAAQKAAEKAAADAEKARLKEIEKAEKEAQKEKEKKEKARQQSIKNVAKSGGSTVGREIGQTVGKAIGGDFGKKLGGNLGASLGRGLMDTLFKK